MKNVISVDYENIDCNCTPKLHNSKGQCICGGACNTTTAIYQVTCTTCEASGHPMHYIGSTQNKPSRQMWAVLMLVKTVQSTRNSRPKIILYAKRVQSWCGMGTYSACMGVSHACLHLVKAGGNAVSTRGNQNADGVIQNWHSKIQRLGIHWSRV